MTQWGQLYRRLTAEDHINDVGKVGLSIAFKEVVVRDNKATIFDNWGKGDIYVVTSVIDGSGRKPEFKTQQFPGIKKGDKLPLGDGGLLAGYITNPEWFLDVHMLVMESDSNLQQLGALISEVKEQVGLTDALEAAGKLARFDAGTLLAVSQVVDTFLLALAHVLQKQGDDHIATIHDFYLKQQGFGAGRHPETSLRKYQGVEAAFQIDLQDL